MNSSFYWIENETDATKFNQQIHTNEFIFNFIYYFCDSFRHNIVQSNIEWLLVSYNSQRRNENGKNISLTSFVVFRRICKRFQTATRSNVDFCKFFYDEACHDAVSVLLHTLNYDWRYIFLFLNQQKKVVWSVVVERDCSRRGRRAVGRQYGHDESAQWCNACALQRRPTGPDEAVQCDRWRQLRVVEGRSDCVRHRPTLLGSSNAARRTATRQAVRSTEESNETRYLQKSTSSINWLFKYFF